MGLLWKDYVVETFDKEGYVEKVTFQNTDHFNFAYDVIDRMALESPDKTAMVWCNEMSEEHILNFADIKRGSDQAAAFFQQIGIVRGDAVMLILKRHIAFWYCFLGLHKLGAIGVPATNQLMEKDLSYRLDAAEIKAVVCTAEGEIAQRVELTATDHPGVEHLIMARGKRAGWLSLEDGMQAAPEWSTQTAGLRPEGEDPLFVYFSSGTTGMPKMVAHSHSYPLAHIPTAVYWHNTGADDLHFTVSETGWAKAMWGKLYGQWLAGAAIFVYDFNRFHAADMLEHIARYRVTTFCAPPTIYRFLIREDLSQYDLSSLKHLTTAGEALNAEVFNRFLDQTGLKIMEAFGQTETTLLAGTCYWMEPKPGSMGKASPSWEVDIVNEQGQSLPPGEVGEIVVRTGNVKPVGLMTGYWKEEEMTREAWYDGLYHTRDTATRDEDGYLWYVGRTDDMIKASGYRIGPFEVESVIMEHVAVLECAVTGVPDDVRGMVVKATIVLGKGYQPDEALAAEIQEYVKQQTAPYKYPRIIEFVEELPKTISGKIRRTAIRERDRL